MLLVADGSKLLQSPPEKAVLDKNGPISIPQYEWHIGEPRLDEEPAVLLDQTE